MVVSLKIKKPSPPIEVQSSGKHLLLNTNKICIGEGGKEKLGEEDTVIAEWYGQLISRKTDKAEQHRIRLLQMVVAANTKYRPLVVERTDLKKEMFIRGAQCARFIINMKEIGGEVQSGFKS